MNPDQIRVREQGSKPPKRAARHCGMLSRTREWPAMLF